MKKEICCSNFVGLITYLRRQYGSEAVGNVIGGLVDNPEYEVAQKDNPSIIIPISQTHLTDPAYWVSNEFSMALLANVRKVVRDPMPLFKAGRQTVINQLSRNVLFFARLFNPGFLARRSTRINAKFNRTKEVRLKETKSNHIVLELHYRPGVLVTRDICEWNLGIYAGIASISGARELNIQETSCVTKGDPYCTFTLSWKNTTLLRRLAQRILRYWFTDLIDEYEAIVNERDQLIERLTQSEKRHRVLTENSLTGIFIIQNKRIVFVNERFTQMLQATGDAIVGRNFWYFIHADDRPLVREKASLSQEGTLKPTNLELRLKRHDGSLVWVNVLVTGIHHNGEPAVMGNAFDISARKNAEEERMRLKSQLQQAQKMEAIGTLAGGIAHDFNNILAAIMGYAELAQLDLSGNEPVNQNIEQILKASHRAKDLVRQILTFSRVTEQDKKPVDVARIVEETIKLLRATLPASIEIQQSVDSDVAPILADATQLYQVLMNLCTNAAHAMEADGGLLQVSAANITLDGHKTGPFSTLKPGKYVQITVADNGCGIDPATAERMFDPYFTTKKPGKGTGLGLSVVMGIVKSHHGDIRMDSRPAEGTTFELAFPIFETQTSGLALQSFRPAKGNGRILLVDDEQQLVDIGKSILERLGYSVCCRTDAVSALETFKTRPDQYDLVITDMNMPGMSGARLSRELIKLRPNLPIILCTGYSEQITREKADDMGIREILLKPITLSNFSEAVNRALYQN